MALQIRRLSYALGAEVLGVDLRKPVDDDVFRQIHSAFLEHCVLLFREQDLTREQQVVFSRRFGELDTNKVKTFDKKDREHPEISFVISRPEADGKPATGRYTGQDWHSDRSHLPTPAMASLLRSVEVPDVGGDTMFANMYLAYESLSDGMKNLLKGLYAVHLDGKTKVDNSTPERMAETRLQAPQAAHPIAKVHPETGRTSLFISEQVRLFVGMTMEESKPLVQFLTDHAVRPQFIYRHKWQKDDLLMWDNRCLMHIAVGDYDKTKVRHMERTTVLGHLTGYVYDGPL